MAEAPRTLIPQFTIRRILAITALAAIAAFVASLGQRGQAWASGVAVALTALLVAFAVYALFFFLAWAVAGIFRNSKNKSAGPGAASKTLLTILFSVGGLLLSPHTSYAVSGGTMTLPVLGPNQVNSTGLELTVDTVWLDASGYRPVRLKLKSITGPVVADRVLTVRFRPHVGYVNKDSMVVTQSMEIPAGSSEAAITLSAPQEGNWGSFELDVFENGKYIDPLSIGASGVWASWSGSYQDDENKPAILHIGDFKNLPRFNIATDTQLAEVDLTGSKKTTAGNPAAPNPSSTPSLYINELPTRWIDYSGIDVVLISREELGTFVEQQAAPWQAIQKWLRGGGTLVVYDAGNKWDKIAEVESLLSIADSEVSATEEEIDLAKRGWNLPDKRKRLSAQPSADQTVSPPATTVESTTPQIVSAREAPFVTRPYGLGMVAAIRTDRVTGFSGAGPWLKHTLGDDRLLWSHRYGMSMLQANNDVWNFLIPGVGLAPVGMFQICITLFVLAIGPVNYFLLRRWGKLNLMILTVPLGAVIVIATLVIVALTADGLGVRLRSRSITNIDQQTGDTTCWARLSYYAGLTPSGGLEFSENTVVLPLEDQPAAITEQGPTHVLDWWRSEVSDKVSPLEQKLSSGWIGARTPTQFITQRVGKTTAKLEIRESTDRPPEVLNRLQTRIKQLILVDEQGNCFGSEEVAPGSAAVLTPAASQSEAFLKRMNTLLVDNEPRLPPNMIMNMGHRGLFGLGGQQQPFYTPYSSSQSYSGSSITQATGILEQSIHNVVDQLQNNKLPPRTYVAIVETSPEMELGTPVAKEETSFHLVVGKW